MRSGVRNKGFAAIEDDPVADSRKVRRAEMALSYKGDEVAKTTKAFSFCDYGQGKADEISVTLEDRLGRWRGSWFPTKGDKLTATITCRDWFAQGQNVAIPCGSFEIDEMELSGPPDQVTVKAISANVTKSLRLEKKTASYENTRLSRIAQDIAKRNGLELHWDAEDIAFDRVDQTSEPDLRFLKRLCDQYGLSLKVAEEKLIVYDAARWDSRAPSLTIARAGGWLVGYQFQTKAFDVYSGCDVEYWDAERKRLVNYSYSPPTAPNVGHKHVINKRVRGRTEAERVAKAELRKKNKGEVTGNLVMVGYPHVRGGLIAAISGFGVFDGNYFIEEVRHDHDATAGLTTGVKIRRVLGY